MTDADGDAAEDVLHEIADAVATLPPGLRALAGDYEPYVLHAASAAGEIDLVRALLDAGLGPDTYPCTEDEDDEPPLVWIARHRDKSSDAPLDVARLLIERGADVDEGLPLLTAAEQDDQPMISLLLAAGADQDLALINAGEEGAVLRERLARD